MVDYELEYKHPLNIRVFLAGDSTVSSYDSSAAPRAGWGQVISQLFDDRITVVNRASSGRSSKSFIDEGKLSAIINQIDQGDYLFIQFGHNDAKQEDETRYTDPESSFKSCLRQYIMAARNKKAIPVLITPVERRRFDPYSGLTEDSHGLYPQAIKELAEEMHVPVIDLTARSKTFFNEIGEEGTKRVFLCLEPGESANYAEGLEDNTHFQEKGAVAIAKLVVEGIIEAKLPLERCIRKL